MLLEKVNRLRSVLCSMETSQVIKSRIYKIPVIPGGFISILGRESMILMQRTAPGTPVEETAFTEHMSMLHHVRAQFACKEDII